MSLPTIAITNESTCLSDAQVQAVIPSLQWQVTQHFNAYWNLDCSLKFLPRTEQLTEGWWQIVVTDDPDQAGALGYHELTNAGAPLGRGICRARYSKRIIVDRNIKPRAFRDAGGSMDQLVRGVSRRKIICTGSLRRRGSGQPGIRNRRRNGFGFHYTIVVRANTMRSSGLYEKNFQRTRTRARRIHFNPRSS